MWVTPDGKVYLYPPWEGPEEGPQFVEPCDFPHRPNPIDQLLQDQAKTREMQAKARWWEARAKNEERKGWRL